MPEDVRHRFFIAVEVEEPARAALERAVRPLWHQHPGLRWNDPDTWHVALAFLGSIPAQRLAEVDAVAAAAADRPPIALRLDGRAGTFTGGVFFAVVEESPQLGALVEDVTERLEEVGLGVHERRFAPHCTLARVPRGSRLPGRLLGDYEGPAVTWTARRVNVLRSRLRVGGVTHELLGTHRFAGAR